MINEIQLNMFNLTKEYRKSRGLEWAEVGDVLDCPVQLAFILLNTFQIKEKLEHAIFSVSLI